MKVVKVSAAGRKAPWKLDGSFGGRRVRLFFATEREALAEMRRLSTERGETGPLADRLSPRERIVLAELRDEVVRAGGTMEGAVAFWLAHAAAPARPMRLWDLLEDAIETKEREGKSDRYLTQLRSAVGQLCRYEGTGDLWAHELTGERVRRWAQGNGWAGKTRRNYLIDVRTTLEHGRRVGAVRTNATDGIELPSGSMEGEDVAVLSVREAARLVAVARRRGKRDGLLLPYVVLGLFAGLRPERELGSLRLGQIKLEDGGVVVDGRTAKSRARRTVDLGPGALRLLSAGVAELEAYWRAQGWNGGRDEMPLCPRNFRRRWESLRVAAGLGAWPPDVMRHSFASYHYALHQNEALLKAQMGHAQDSGTLWRHYRMRVSRREADRFWRIGAGV